MSCFREQIIKNQHRVEELIREQIRLQIKLVISETTQVNCNTYNTMALYNFAYHWKFWLGEYVGDQFFTPEVRRGLKTIVEEYLTPDDILKALGAELFKEITIAHIRVDTALTKVGIDHTFYTIKTEAANELRKDMMINMGVSVDYAVFVVNICNEMIGRSKKEFCNVVKLFNNHPRYKDFSAHLFWASKLVHDFSTDWVSNVVCAEKLGIKFKPPSYCALSAIQKLKDHRHTLTVVNPDMFCHLVISIADYKRQSQNVMTDDPEYENE